MKTLLSELRSPHWSLYTIVFFPLHLLISKPNRLSSWCICILSSSIPVSVHLAKAGNFGNFPGQVSPVSNRVIIFPINPYSPVYILKDLINHFRFSITLRWLSTRISQLLYSQCFCFGLLSCKYLLTLDVGPHFCLCYIFVYLFISQDVAQHTQVSNLFTLYISNLFPLQF